MTEISTDKTLKKPQNHLFNAPNCKKKIDFSSGFQHNHHETTRITFPKHCNSQKSTKTLGTAPDTQNQRQKPPFERNHCSRLGEIQRWRFAELESQIRSECRSAADSRPFRRKLPPDTATKALRWRKKRAMTEYANAGTLGNRRDPRPGNAWGRLSSP